MAGEAQKMAQMKPLPANTNMKLCLALGQTRGALCLRTIPGPREL